jgi:Transposase IS4
VVFDEEPAPVSRSTLRPRGNVDPPPRSEFDHYFSDELLATAVKNTNKYAAAHDAGRGHPWREVDIEELRRCLGVVIYMGIFCAPRIEDYWENNDRQPDFRVSFVMSLMHCQQIKRFLHVSDHENDDSKSFFFNKVEPLLSHVRAVAKKHWIPGRRVSVYKMMVICHGRSAETVRMKYKPIGSCWLLRC